MHAERERHTHTHILTLTLPQRSEVRRNGFGSAAHLQQIGACLVHAPILGAKRKAKRFDVQLENLGEVSIPGGGIWGCSELGNFVAKGQGIGRH